MDSIDRIVRDKDMKALERFCQTRTYRQVREAAIATGVDLDELEELLAQIS